MKAAEGFITPEMIGVATGAISRRLTMFPKIGMVLGSGLGVLADAVAAEATIPYADIPYFPRVTVWGQQGQLVAGWLEDQPVIAMQGRFHYYEGYSMVQVTMPVRVMQALGVEILIVTNAAGGLNSTFSQGDVMVIRDHINLLGMAGFNPLRGPNLDRFGTRFLDMSQPYDPDLRAQAVAIAAEAGIPCHEGVYVCLSGPSYETPAEVNLLRLIGADAVGMSTAPEVVVARHGGTRVLGLSGISNAVPAEPSVKPVTHEGVLAAGVELAPRLERIIRGVLKQQ